MCTPTADELATAYELCAIMNGYRFADLIVSQVSCASSIRQVRAYDRAQVLHYLEHDDEAEALIASLEIAD